MESMYSVRSCIIRGTSYKAKAHQMSYFGQRRSAEYDLLSQWQNPFNMEGKLRQCHCLGYGIFWVGREQSFDK